MPSSSSFCIVNYMASSWCMLVSKNQNCVSLRICKHAVALPSKVSPAKATKRLAPVSRRLYTTIEKLLLCELKLNSYMISCWYWCFLLLFY
jgi:hypothetical protein